MNTELLLLATHVAGPPEREPADTSAGWRWAQRCLRCDTTLCWDLRTTGQAPGGFFKLGQRVYDLGDGGVTVELPDGAVLPDDCLPSP